MDPSCGGGAMGAAIMCGGADIGGADIGGAAMEGAVARAWTDGVFCAVAIEPGRGVGAFPSGDGDPDMGEGEPDRGDGPGTLDRGGGAALTAGGSGLGGGIGAGAATGGCGATGGSDGLLRCGAIGADGPWPAREGGGDGAPISWMPGPGIAAGTSGPEPAAPDSWMFSTKSPMYTLSFVLIT